MVCYLQLLSIAAVCLVSWVGGVSALPVEDNLLPQVNNNQSVNDDINTRIVGGVNANIINFPYQLAMLNNGQLGCGASIISPWWAVTAAHCSGGSTGSMSLRAGSSYHSTGGTVHRVSQKIIHPAWNQGTAENDIALLRVSTPFAYRTGVQPIGLPGQGQTVPGGVTVTVTGWGRLWGGGPLPNVLQKVDLISLGVNAGCRQRHLCAVSRTGGGQSVCNGDSGGPMTYRNQLVGVATFVSPACGVTGARSGYARVSEMRDWIRQSTGV